MINVGKFFTSTGRHYNVFIRANGKSLKTVQIIGNKSGTVLDVVDLGTYLAELKKRNQLIKHEVDWQMLKKITGRDHSHPDLL